LPAPSTPPAPQYPALDSALAAPCLLPDAPAVADYDVWQEWIEQKLVPAFADCAIRHRQTVAAWPKN
jgi:hypothetical protein